MDWLILVIAVCFGLAALKFYKDSEQIKSNRETIINYAFYKAILDSFVERAYEVIHKDKLFIYSLEATRPKDEEFNEVTKEFLQLVEKLMGPRLVKIYVEVYGTRDAFLFNLAEYFNTKYENDEIRKTSMDNMMNQELDVTEDKPNVTT
jgi:hypothetical protein